jgi:hypothetical protein
MWKIFGPKREGNGSWRKLHNDELHNLYSSQNIVRVIKSRRMRWAGHVARMEDGRGVYRALVGRPEGKRPLGRPRRRWEDNIKMDLREIGIAGANWFRLAQDRVPWRAFVNTVMKLQVSFKLFLDNLSDYQPFKEYPAPWNKYVNDKISKSVILSFVLYGCGTWSVILRAAQRFSVFLKKILELKRE